MVVTRNQSSSVADVYDSVIFEGRHNIDLMRRLIEFRVSVWSTIESESLAIRRFGMDSSDEIAWHVVYLDGRSIIACGRLTLVSTPEEFPDQCSFGPYLQDFVMPAGILNRLVVDPDYQGMGLGTCINQDRVALARRLGMSVLVVEVQKCRIDTMARHGFTEVGVSSDTSVKGDWRIMRCSI